MALQALPTEILQEICSYNSSDSLSVTSKYIRSVALKFVLDTIRLTAIDQKFEAILKFISKEPRNAYHIRKVILDSKYPANHLVRRLFTFLDSLKGLKAMQCSDQAATILRHKWEAFSRYEIAIDAFYLSEDLEHDSYGLYSNLPLRHLTSLDVCVGLMPGGNISDDSEGSMMSETEEQIRYLGEAVILITSVARNLKHLRLSHSWAREMTPIPLTAPYVASVLHLNLSCILSFDVQLLEVIGEATDLDKLESIALPMVPGLDFEWLCDVGLSFKQLKRLFLPLLCAYDWDSSTVPSITRFLRSLPPLKELELFGDYHRIVSTNVLNHHNTVESLILHDKPRKIFPDIVSLQRNQFEQICQLRHLQKLRIKLPRLEEDSWRAWSLLRSLPLRHLILILDSASYLRSASTSTDRTSQLMFLQHAALDESLARSIYEYLNLDVLEIDMEHQDHKDFTKSVRQEHSDYGIVLAEIARSYKVTRVYGQVVALRTGTIRSNLEQPDHASELMADFRTLWPPRAGGDWRSDWSSKPFVAV